MLLAKRNRIFQKAAWAVFITYFGLMVYVIIIAHQRQSGVTRMDPAQIVQIRHKANQEHAEKALESSIAERP